MGHSDKFSTYFVSTRVIVGAGVSERVGHELAGRGIRRVLLVTDEGVLSAGLTRGVEEALRAEGMGYTLFSRVEPNPSVATVEAALQLYQREGCSAIVAVGGGSPMDSAKALGILATNGGHITSYEGVGKVRKPLPFLAALPTTCGTGSEATSFAVITDPARRFKFAVGSPHLFPDLALVDPVLMLGLPPDLAGTTSMDALTHAIESFTSRFSMPITEGLALEAVSLIARNLRRVVRGGAGLEGVEALAVASTMAGMAFTNTRLGNVHAMAHTLGGHFGLPHGMANAILLPYVMDFNLPACPEKYGRVARAMGEEVESLNAEAAGRRAIEAVRHLASEVGIPATLSEVSCREEEIATLADDSMKSGNVAANPRETSRQDIMNIFRAAFAGKW